MDENKLLLATIEDKLERFHNYYCIVNTDFLNLSQQAAARGLIQANKDVKAFFYGGFTDAERRQLIFVPDYVDAEDETGLIEYFHENPDLCPLVVLELSYQGGAKGKNLGHRDFLGSLLAEGIKREKLGDILVSEGGAQVVVAKELSEYLAANYGKAGRIPLNVEVKPISCIQVSASSKQVVNLTVSSPRLDNIISAVFHVSRKEAVSAINQGKVFVDSLEICKPDFQLRGGEKVVLRGKGKALYVGTSGTSRKGKLYITLEKYV